MSFVRINNTFIDNLHKFSSCETRLLLAIARYSVGMGKRQVKISQRDLHQQTGVSMDAVKRSLKTLLDTSRNVLKMEAKGNAHTYELLSGSGLIFDTNTTNILAFENTYTPIDNTFFDNLPNFNNPQTKIMLIIARYTFGANVDVAKISMPIFQNEGGIEPKILMKNVAILEKQGNIQVLRENNKKGNTYKIISYFAEKTQKIKKKPQEPNNQGVLDFLADGLGIT